MTPAINYILHRTKDPANDYRQIEHDLPPKSTHNWLEISQRAAKITLPFLSLYRPLGQKITYVLGGCRVITHLSGTYDAIQNRKILDTLSETASSLLAIASLASTLFQYRIGTIVTTTVDTSQNIATALYHLYKGKHEQLPEDLIQVTSSSLYLAVMVTQSLQIVLVSIIFQALLSAYQSHTEWNQCKTPEAIAKLLMCFVRVYEGNKQWDLLQRYNLLLENPLFKHLSHQIAQGRKVEHLLSSPLQEMGEHNHVYLEDAKGKSHDFGAHFHSYGKSLVKGGNLCFRTKIVNDTPIVELDFKINHAFRADLQTALQQLSDACKLKELNDLLTLSHSHVKQISISEGSYELGGFSHQDAYKITFDGIGSVFVGSDKDVVAFYNRIFVQLDPGANLFQLHELLCFLNLQTALQLFSLEDIERLKIGQLFRIFFPQDAITLERTRSFFDLPLDQLKSRIISQVPSMRFIFDNLLPTMEAYEILPGRVRYRIPHLSKICKQLGAHALISSVTTTSSRHRHNSDEEFLDRIASIIKMGQLSSELRYGSGMNISGLSSNFDLDGGGSDSVFTQLVTEQDIRHGRPLTNFAYFDGAAFIYSLDILETGTYQYTMDSYGTREYPDSDYDERPTIFELIQQLSASFSFTNEVMIKERIPPTYIQGIALASHEQYLRLLNHLRLKKLTQINEQGIETILNIPIDKFFRIGIHLTPQPISSA